MNEALQFSADRLKNFIMNNELVKVLEELSYFTKGRFREMFNEITLHFSNLNELRQDFRLNVVDYAQFKQAENRIKLALLQLIDELESLLSADNSVSIQPNKSLMIFVVNADYTTYTDVMGSHLLDIISSYLNIDKEQLTIKGTYAGSIKIIIEADDKHVRALVDKFNTNPTEIQKLFGTIEVKDIANAVKIQAQIALTFYNLLINQSPDYDSALHIYYELEKHNIQPNVETFINLILQAPDYQTALVWKGNMIEKNIETNEVFYSIMEAKKQEEFNRQLVFPTINTTKKRQPPRQDDSKEILNLCYEAMTKSLKKRSLYSIDLCQELSSQLVFNIFSRLDDKPIETLPNYIRTASKNLVINHGMKAKGSQEVATDPFALGINEATDDFTTLDVMIKEEYEDLNAHQLETIRKTIGDKDYLMLEANFREGESYKTIAAKMGLDVHIVANHINRARKKCQLLRDYGKITF
jgi:DNA-directed RNA polymerase specialized sigma24 family protein